MEQARLQCQQHPGYGYPTEAAAAWMVARRDNTPDVVSSKYHQRGGSGPYLVPLPVSSSASAAAPRSAMARRNERERKRVRLVNHGFATLRQYLPQSNNARKKLSKMETLRSAIEYIKQLQFLLDPTASSTQASGSAAHSPQFGESSSDPPSWSASGPPSWDDSWAQQQQQQTTLRGRSPSPHTSLSPEADLIDFGAFS